MKKHSSENPHPVDIHVGQRLRQRRTLQGLSQTALAKGVNLTFQQIQKYERGANRVGASRLHQFSQILDVPVSYFFDGYEHDAPVSLERDPLTTRKVLELARYFTAIPDGPVKETLFRLVKVTAQQETGKLQKAA